MNGNFVEYFLTTISQIEKNQESDNDVLINYARLFGDNCLWQQHPISEVMGKLIIFAIKYQNDITKNYDDVSFYNIEKASR